MGEDQDKMVKLRFVIFSCNRCNFENRQFLIGEGAKYGYMLIGESPSLHPERNLYVFAGRSKPVLEEVLKFLGKRREEVYLTNVVKCYTPLIEVGNWMYCQSILYEEINIVQPHTIIVFGSQTMKNMGLTDKPWTTRKDLGGRKWVFAHHPMTVIRGLYTMQEYMFRFKGVFDLPCKEKTSPTS